MWTQKIEYVDADEITLPPPVKKQVWNSEKQEFVPMTLYRHIGFLRTEQQDWMHESFGPPGTYRNGQYWDTTRAGGYTVMDEKVYMWFAMKWINK